MVLDDIFQSDKSTLMFLLFGFILIAVSGIVFGMTFFVMDTVETALENTNCVIDNNAFFDDCQDMWELAAYPFLALKSVLVYLDMFMIFILAIGMLLIGYNSGSRPYMLGVLVLVNMAYTYGAIWVGNIYRDLLANEIIRTAMIEFSVYNKIMLNFPWFVFIISLFSLSIGIVNWQRIRRNTPEGELDY